MALLRLHSFPDPINPMNFYPSIGGLCPGLHTGNNNSYGYSRHPPPPPPPPSPPPPPPCQVYLKKPTSVNHIQFISPTFPFSTPPTPTTHTHPFLFIILLLCNCLDDNALHIIARHGSIREWRQFVYMGHTVQSSTNACTLSKSNAYLAFAVLS